MTVRLDNFELTSICRCFKKYFLPEDHLWLFGSRVNKDALGGDIDLYAETHLADLKTALRLKIDFLVDVKDQIGEQRIDFIIRLLNDSNESPIQKQARATGVLLI